MSIYNVDLSGDDIISYGHQHEEALNIKYTGDATAATAAISSNTLTTTLTAAPACVVTYGATATTATVTIDGDDVDIDLTGAPAMEITYGGSGTAAAAEVSGTDLILSLEGAPVAALSYDGSGTAATATKATTTLTLLVEAHPGIDIQYTGAGTACEMSFDGSTLTTVCEGAGADDLVLDVSDEANNTLTELAGVIAAGNYTCTVNAEATGTWDSALLDEVVAQDIKTGSYTATYTGADQAIDLSHGDNNTVTELVAVLDALDNYSCTVDGEATGTWDTANITDGTYDITTSADLTYTGTDLTYDLTHGDNNTLTKIVDIVEALGNYSCTIDAEATGAWASQTLEEGAYDITVGATLTWAGEDHGIDMSHGDYNTLTEVVGAIHGYTNYTCTIDDGATAAWDSSGLVDGTYDITSACIIPYTGTGTAFSLNSTITALHDAIEAAGDYTASIHGGTHNGDFYSVDLADLSATSIAGTDGLTLEWSQKDWPVIACVRLVAHSGGAATAVLKDRKGNEVFELSAAASGTDEVYPGDDPLLDGLWFDLSAGTADSSDDLKIYFKRR